MPDLDLEPLTGDFVLDQEGGVSFAAPGDALRQRIFRRIITNPDGYIYHPEYGLGLGQLIGRAMTRDQKEKLKQKIIQGILEDAETDKSVYPTITITEPALKRMDIHASFQTITGISSQILIQVDDID